MLIMKRDQGVVNRFEGGSADARTTKLKEGKVYQSEYLSAKIFIAFEV